LNKKAVGPGTILYPMPVLIIGSEVDGKPNFMTASWAGIACSTPPMISVSFQPKRHTYKGVRANRTFSVNIPSVAQMKEADYCGIVSGNDGADKAADCGFEIFHGTLEGAPMIGQCPVSLECSVVITLQLGSHDLVVAEIKEVHVSEDCLTSDGKIDPVKVNPIAFSVPDRNYRGVGDVVGKAFSVGKELKG